MTHWTPWRPGAGRPWDGGFTRWAGLLAALTLAGLLALGWLRAPLDARPACPGSASSLCRVLDQAQPDGVDRPQPLPWVATGPQSGERPTRLHLTWRLPATRGVITWGLCLPRAPLVAAQALDGRPLPGPGARPERFMRPWSLALGPLDPVSRHTVTLEVLAPSGLTAGLGPVLLGPATEMAAHCEALSQRLHGRLVATQVALVLLALAGLLLAWRQGERAALWFALTALAWALHLEHLQTADASLEDWGRMYFATRVAFVPPLLLLALAWAGRPLSRWRVPFASGCAVAAAMLMLLPPVAWNLWLRTVAWAALPVALLTLGWLAGGLRRAFTLSRLTLCAALGLVLLAQELDLLRWELDAGYGGPLWTYVTVPLVACAFVVQVVERVMARAPQVPPPPRSKA